MTAWWQRGAGTSGTKVVTDKRVGGRVAHCGLNFASPSVLSYVSLVLSPKVMPTFCSGGLT